MPYQWQITLQTRFMQIDIASPAVLLHPEIKKHKQHWPAQQKVFAHETWHQCGYDVLASLKPNRKCWCRPRWRTRQFFSILAANAAWYVVGMVCVYVLQTASIRTCLSAHTDRHRINDIYVWRYACTCTISINRQTCLCVHANKYTFIHACLHHEVTYVPEAGMQDYDPSIIVQAYQPTYSLFQCRRLLCCLGTVLQQKPNQHQDQRTYSTIQEVHAVSLSNMKPLKKQLSSRVGKRKRMVCAAYCCETLPCFNKESSTAGRFCAQHKEAGMVDVYGCCACQMLDGWLHQTSNIQCGVFCTGIVL